MPSVAIGPPAGQFAGDGGVSDRNRDDTLGSPEHTVAGRFVATRARCSKAAGLHRGAIANAPPRTSTRTRIEACGATQ